MILIVRAENEEQEKLTLLQVKEEMEHRFAIEESKRDEKIREITGKYVRT